MIISNISVKNFGPLIDCDIQLKDGLNIITGLNSTGKTQLFGAILFCFFGPRVLRIDENSQSDSYVRLAYKDDKHEQTIEYTYSNGRFLKTFTDQRNALVNDTSIHHYENSFHKYMPSFISDMAFIKELPNTQDFELVTKIVAHDTSLREKWNGIKRKYEPQINEMQNTKIVISSIGEEWLLKLIKRVIIQMQNESPIIIDEAFIYLDGNTIKFLMGLLNILSRNQQIILFSSPAHVEKEDIVYSLSLQNHTLSNLAYNYEFTEKLLYSQSKEIPHNQDKPVIIRYILDTQLQEEEYRQVEFKEIKGKNPIDSIKNVVDEYVVAFLNDYTNYKGMIIWGITDIERKIIGVKLDYNQRDTLRRVITEKLSKINPSIPPSSYNVQLQPVYDRGKNQIKDLYIVEVLVETTRSKLLYATAGNEVFIKTDGGKKKLTSMEIQQEVLRRQ
jgi:hypothetical protein